MLTEWWKGIGGKLAERFLALATPAVLFWLAGLGSYAWANRGTKDLQRAARWLDARPPTLQLVVIVATLMAITATAILVDQLSNPVLRLLEGYWPRLAKPLRRPFVWWHRKRASDGEVEWQRLQEAIEAGTASPWQVERALHLERRLREYPSDPARLLPTKLGNILRAAELRSVMHYGLDVVHCWGPLWMSLPDHARGELTVARASLDSGVRSLIWALLILCWTPLAWLAAPLALAIATAVWLAILPARARVYATVLEAVVQVHRGKLYDALRWPLPFRPADERAAGAEVTEYLWRGSTDRRPRFR
ncbi:hypothetical protein ACWCYZ_38140 [Streptomyces virginiae]